MATEDHTYVFVKGQGESNYNTYGYYLLLKSVHLQNVIIIFRKIVKHFHQVH